MTTKMTRSLPVVRIDDADWAVVRTYAALTDASWVGRILGALGLTQNIHYKYFKRGPRQWWVLLLHTHSHFEAALPQKGHLL